MTDDVDPKLLALRRFAGAPRTGGLDIVGRYATDPPLVVQTLLGAVAGTERPRGRICELGFGSGWLLEDLVRRFAGERVYGLDLSAGAVLAARERFGASMALAAGDIERLPFADGSIDVVVTCWTLYFMRDIDAALEEIRRCLAPGGRIAAATVAPDHERELEELVDEAYRAGAGRERKADISVVFDTATGGEHMRRHFADVTLLEWQGTMTLPDVELAMVLWDDWLDPLPAEALGRVTSELRRLVAERIGRDGELRMRRHGGAFVGRVPGGTSP